MVYIPVGGKCKTNCFLKKAETLCGTRRNKYNRENNE